MTLGLSFKRLRIGTNISNFFICIAAVCWVNYGLFCNETIEDILKIGQLPTREEFFMHYVHPVEDTTDNECFICDFCSSLFESTVQVQPCGHQLCSGHILMSVEQGYRTCPHPQCGMELFVDPHPVLEASSRLLIATSFLNIFVASIMLRFSGKLSRKEVVFGTVSTVVWVMLVLDYWGCRWQYGVQWWRHLMDPLYNEGGNLRSDPVRQAGTVLALITAFGFLVRTSAIVRDRHF